ncbi:class I SAM-dependent methyltransferase [candidate division WOR-3 bacterium]|nr:class I SAM-dependent methyltransferase [candidate division WOR-3 bacterium]
MKPDIWNPERAESFKSPDTVAAYRFRAPYPAETFEILSGLVTDSPRVVLDVGCGRGEIARNLVFRLDRVDAVDFSSPMIEAGRKLPLGNHPHLHWIHGRAEDAPLNPPYNLITCGMSLHWLDWDVVIPRFAEILKPDGFLATVANLFGDFPWSEELRSLRVSYRGYESARPHKAIEELEKLGLFTTLGESVTSEVVHSNTVEEYIEQYHSRSDMARVQLGREASERFDEEFQKLIAKYTSDKIIKVRYRTKVTWGRPKQ